jgi:Fe-S cluster assembly iron-binding protein IscA
MEGWWIEMINLTQNAVEKFNELRNNSENPEKLMIRVSFGGYG